MELTIERDGDVVFATATGILDASTGKAFQTKLEAEIRETDRGLIVDVEEMVLSASAGLRIVLVLAKLLDRQNGRLVLCRVSEQTRQILRISCFDKIIAIAEDRETAWRMMRGL